MQDRYAPQVSVCCFIGAEDQLAVDARNARGLGSVEG